MQTLPYNITGNNDSEYMIVFLHGWPDSIKLWDQIIDLLHKNDPDTLKLAISYPNYDSRETSRCGTSIQNILLRIKHTIDMIDNNKNRKKILVGHDWGSFFLFSLDKMYPKYF